MTSKFVYPFWRFCQLIYGKLSRENTNAMFRDYSEFFEEDSHDGQEGIRLRAGKSRKD